MRSVTHFHNVYGGSGTLEGGKLLGGKGIGQPSMSTLVSAKHPSCSSLTVKVNYQPRSSRSSDLQQQNVHEFVRILRYLLQDDIDDGEEDAEQWTV